MNIRDRLAMPSNEEWHRSMKWFIPKLLFRFYAPIVICWGAFAVIVLLFR